MGKPAARIGDMHVCPMVTPGVPPVPHVGGPIMGPGCPTVLIGGMPAAVLGDMCTCVGPPSSIILGSIGVMIGGKPAARMGDICAHGGTIVAGLPTVLIGEINVPAPGAPSAPGAPVKPDPEVSKLRQKILKTNTAMATTISRMEALVKGAENGDDFVHVHSEEECKVQYLVTGPGDVPLEDVQYEIKTSDGKTFAGKTGTDGLTQQISGYTEGMCTLSFPD